MQFSWGGCVLDCDDWLERWIKPTRLLQMAAGNALDSNLLLFRVQEFLHLIDAQRGKTSPRVQIPPSAAHNGLHMACGGFEALSCPPEANLAARRKPCQQTFTRHKLYALLGAVFLFFSTIISFKVFHVFRKSVSSICMSVEINFQVCSPTLIPQFYQTN